MSIIQELHTRLSRLPGVTAKVDEWSLPLTPTVGVGFMEEIRTIISDAIRTAFVDYPTRDDGSQWDHQVGAASAAFGAGLSRTELASYLPAFFAAGLLCIVAALMTLAIA